MSLGGASAIMIGVLSAQSSNAEWDCGGGCTDARRAGSNGAGDPGAMHAGGLRHVSWWRLPLPIAGAAHVSCLAREAASSLPLAPLTPG